MSSSLTCFTTCQKRGINLLRIPPGRTCVFSLPLNCSLVFSWPDLFFSRHKSTRTPRRTPSCLPLFPICQPILSRVLTRSLGLHSSVLDVARPCVRHSEILAPVAHQRGGRGLGFGCTTSRRLGLGPCAPSFARVVPGETTIERLGREILVAIDLSLARHTVPSSSFLRRHQLRSIRRLKSCAVLWSSQTDFDCTFKDTTFKEWKPC